MAGPGYRLQPTTIGHLSETKNHDRNIPALVTSMFLQASRSSSWSITRLCPSNEGAQITSLAALKNPTHAPWQLWRYES